MKHSFDILKELEIVSPVVASIGKNNVFTVPDGYFDTLSGIILASVINEAVAAGDAPEGYFDSLSNNILTKIEGTAANELHQLSPLLAGIKKVNPFEVPDNYFDEMGNEISWQVTADNIPAIVENASKEQPFKVPAGYFDQLAYNIVSNIKEQSGAKVVAMPKRSTSILKYAAAAVFTGIMVFGVYKSINPAPENGGVINPGMTASAFTQKLENLPEEDIVKYLERNGTQEDIAALTSGIDEADLPDQEDYFIDNATLDKFLEDIELKN